MRDGFPGAVKTELAKRVNFHCSICDAQTVGPKANTDKSFSIGKAAHIKAAAPGGPRYDLDQTSEERSSINNGIWACAICAEIIDRDEGAYPVEELHRLKTEAERLARTRIGRAPATPAVLESASSIQRAVEAFCRSEAAHHEELDPRFSVIVSQTMDGTVYELHAKETVSAKLSINGQDLVQHIQALNDVIAYGGSHTLEGLDVRMEGSPLFPGVEDACQRLQVSSEFRPATLTILSEAEADVPMYLEFLGRATSGAKGLRFTGEALSGLIVATLTADLVDKAINFSFRFNLQRWAGKRFRQLPQFARVQQAIRSLEKSQSARLSFSMDDVEVELGSGTLDEHGYVKTLNSFLSEVAALRKLDAFLDLNLSMPADLDDILRDRGNISELLSLIDIRHAEKQEIIATLVPADPVNTLVDAIANKQVIAIKLAHTFTLQILGTSYGPFTLEMLCLQGMILPVGPANILPGKPIQLLLQATQGQHWTARCVPSL